jgi:hypothetical protein
MIFLPLLDIDEPSMMSQCHSRRPMEGPKVEAF